MPLWLYEGNEALAWAAVQAGCRFFAGYPITPATSIYNSMLKLLPPQGGVVLQAEDEIAAIGYCLGAAMAGCKAMTATSGPGLSLFSEHISFAVGSEIPLVIANVQRLGPSTGSATRGADGDVQFMRWGNSGGLPVIVLAPADVRDCVILTHHAFNWAEQYRCPVFIASNKEVGQTKESIDLDELELPSAVERSAPPVTDAYLPFQPLPGSDVPGFLPIGGSTLVRQTSSTHGPDGYITTDPETIAATNQRLYRKLENAVKHITLAEHLTAKGADTLLITYGVTARAARQLFIQQRSSARPFNLLVLKTLWPVPAALLARAAQAMRRILVAEMNLGQYGREVQRVLGQQHVDVYGQMDGRLISPATLKEVLRG